MNRNVDAGVGVARAELARIPFIDTGVIGDRTLMTLVFYSEDEWHVWHPTPRGLMKLPKAEPIEVDYFAREPQRLDDAYFGFLDFMAQRASWPEVMRCIDGIRLDIHNLAASMAKLALFHRHREERVGPSGTRRYVSTELEYIFGVCRSMFDLLQEVIRNIWNQRVTLTDDSIRKKELPKSFRAVVLKDNKLRGEDAIAERFGLPRLLAHFYFRQGPFFETLRTYRDRVYHGGRGFDWVFVTDRGFAVRDSTKPFCDFGVWNDQHKLPNRLASLRPAVAYVVRETLRSCEEFACVIQKVINFPEEIAPGFRLFMRGPHIGELRRLEAVIAECAWWDDQSSGALEPSST